MINLHHVFLAVDNDPLVHRTGLIGVDTASLRGSEGVVDTAFD